MPFAPLGHVLRLVVLADTPGDLIHGMEQWS